MASTNVPAPGQADPRANAAIVAIVEHLWSKGELNDLIAAAAAARRPLKVFRSSEELRSELVKEPKLQAATVCIGGRRPFRWKVPRFLRAFPVPLMAPLAPEMWQREAPSSRRIPELHSRCHWVTVPSTGALQTILDVSVKGVEPRATEVLSHGFLDAQITQYSVIEQRLHLNPKTRMLLLSHQFHSGSEMVGVLSYANSVRTVAAQMEWIRLRWPRLRAVYGHSIGAPLVWEGINSVNRVSRRLEIEKLVAVAPFIETSSLPSPLNVARQLRRIGNGILLRSRPSRWLATVILLTATAGAPSRGWLARNWRDGALAEAIAVASEPGRMSAVLAAVEAAAAEIPNMARTGRPIQQLKRLCHGGSVGRVYLVHNGLDRFLDRRHVKRAAYAARAEIVDCEWPHAPHMTTEATAVATLMDCLANPEFLPPLPLPVAC